ncbi:MAG: M16 family metallopeptidase [Parachlamydiales bacterium]
MKKLLALLLAPLIACWAAPLPPDPALRVVTLPTGVTSYIWPSEEYTGPISIRLVVPIGSGVEEEGEEGLAHFCEHLVFRGSDRFSESDIQHYIAAAGGGIGADANAFTSFDVTVYLLDLPAGDWSLVEKGLQIFADFAERSRIDDGSVEAERGIVLEEWRLGRTVETRIVEGRIKALLEGSPFAEHLAIGTEETVRHVPAQKIRDFYHRWYGSVPFAIIVTGPVDPDRAEEAIRAAFDTPAFPERQRILPCLPCPIPHIKNLLVTKDPELTHTLVEVSFKHPARPIRDEEDLRCELIAESYHALLTARLHRLQEEGRLSAALIQTGRDHPVSCLETDTFELICPPDAPLEALHTLLQEIHSAAEFGFSEGEWAYWCANAQTSIRGARLEGDHGYPVDLANQCLAHYISGSALCSSLYLLSACERLYPTITREDLRAFAQTLENPAAAFVHIAGPSALPITEADLRLVLDSAQVAARVPYEEPPRTLPPIVPRRGEITPTDYLLFPPLFTYRASNGMTLHFCLTPEQREILVEGVALGGLSSLSPEDLLAGRLANPLLDESGIGGLTPTQLALALAGTDAYLTRSLLTYHRRLSGGAHPEDIETLFKLLHLTFTAQQNRPDIYERILCRQLTYPLGATPAGALERAATALTRSGAPYFQPFSPEAYRSTPFHRVDAIALEAFSNPADFTLIFAGPLDLPKMVELAETYLASIPQTAPPTTHYDPLHLSFPQGITQETLHQGREAQSTVELYFPLQLEDPSPETFTLLSGALDLIRSRTYQVLRQALSATYHVEIDDLLLTPSPDEGLICLSFVCDPADAALLIQVALRELRKLREWGPTPTEVQTLYLQTDRHLQNSLFKSAFWTAEIAAATLYGWDLEVLENVEERAAVITREGLTEMIRTLLPLDNYVALTLYPETLPSD